MQYRSDLKSDNKLSALGFGCMRFTRSMGQIDIKKAEALIMEAIEKGVNYFDTAYLYSGSEEVLGKILESNKCRDKIFLATKLPFMLCHNEADFDKFFYRQLERLKTKYIDYYLLHNMSNSAQWKNLCSMGIEKWIETKKASGEIRQIGFSFHGMKDEFMSLIDLYDWDFCQIQYNYININYQAGQAGLLRAAEKGLPVIIMEPLLGGKLAKDLPPKVASMFKANSSQLSPAGWALRWLWDQPQVTTVLSGMNEFDQMRENIKTAEASTPNVMLPAEKEIIEQSIKIFNETYKVPCTGCNYCMPCPHGVNIPACFSAYNASFAISRNTGMQQYLMGTGATTSKQHFASLCKKCGRCEKHCPQNIPIMKSLEDVSKRMEPFWYKPVLSVVRKVLRVK